MQGKSVKERERMKQKQFLRISYVIRVVAALCYLTEFYLRGRTCDDSLDKVGGQLISSEDGTAQS